MATAAITGSITQSTTEQQIVAGGKQIIITLTGDTWIASGFGDEEFYDSFDTDTTANYTDLINTLEHSTSSGGYVYGTSNNAFSSYHTTNATDTINQYARITFLTASTKDFFITARIPGVTGNYYRFRWTSAGNITWVAMNGTSIVGTNPFTIVNEAVFGGIAPADGDIFGITISGTGSSTYLRAWKNPTATKPINATSWDATDDYDYDSGAKNPDTNGDLAETGKMMGFGCAVNTDCRLFDFYWGDIPA